MYSCQNEDDALTNRKIEVNPEDTVGKIVLGKKLENPYSVKNMRKALESLKKKKLVKAEDVEGIEINTTHLYIEIPTADNAQLDMFVQDTSLELFNHPLDYDLPEEGSFYQDTSFTNYDPTWLYTVVPVDHDLTQVTHTVLEECYLPNDELVETVEKDKSKADLLKLLEYEAYLITGNIKDVNGYNSKARQSPSGTVTVENTEGNPEGLKRVKVRVHNFMRVDSDMTDDSGSYSMSKGFLTNVHYAIIFKNSKDFKIWGNWAFIAPAHYYMGWHSATGLDRQIKKNSGAWKWGTVNNAVYAYYHFCQTYSIPSPPIDFRVWVREKGDGTVTGNAAMLRRTYGLFGFNGHSKVINFMSKSLGFVITSVLMYQLLQYALPDIGISVNTSEVGTDDVYATVFHECAHASHWIQVGSYYWVQYINYIITYGAYGNGTGVNAGYCGVGEMWGNYFGNYVCSNTYFNETSGVNFDASEHWYNPGFLKYVDNISDVTTTEIYDCLTSSTNTINKLVSQLKTKTNYDSEVDRFYGYYSDWP